MVCASKFTAVMIRGTTGELSKLADFQESVFNIIYTGTLHSIALQFSSILSDRISHLFLYHGLSPPLRQICEVSVSTVVCF